MDIKRIQSFLKDCIKLINTPLAGDNLKIAHAFELILIHIGERINGIFKELESFVFKNEILFRNVLNATSTEFNEERFTKDRAYRIQLFRTALNRSDIGKSLMLLNFIRNEIKHHFFYLNAADHNKFRILYIYATPLRGFINSLQHLADHLKDDPANLVMSIFNSKEISPINFDQLTEVEKLFKEAKKTPRQKKKSFDDQKQTLMKRVNFIQELMVKLKEYTDKLERLVIEYANKLADGKTIRNHDVDLYAALMCITAMGESCIKLVEFRKKEGKFDAIFKLKLKEYNDLFQPLSRLATTYTHNDNELPNFTDALRVCRNILTSRTQFDQLATAISELVNVSKETSSESDTDTKHEGKKQKTHEKKLKKEEDVVKIVTEKPSVVPAIVAIGSPIHIPVSKTKRPAAALEDIVEEAAEIKESKSTVSKRKPHGK